MSQYDGPPIRSVYEPSGEEIRAWAYSGAKWPEQDWDILMAEPENLEALVQLVGDPGCPSRRDLLGSLYCTIGHSDHSDSRIAAAIEIAGRSNDLWLSTWARRSKRVIDHPDEFDRDDWCGWDSMASKPVD
ncbi:hypothetical protein AB0L64_27365 [Kribbella sp. NPDC051936]|uniref:hypothetical protein n=1 Tax=Kribbella sp. NPDC051936 TaxID=3154946 RepID=UPI00341431EE